jgi:hypothetical protein
MGHPRPALYQRPMVPASDHCAQVGLPVRPSMAGKRLLGAKLNCSGSRSCCHLLCSDWRMARSFSPSPHQVGLTTDSGFSLPMRDDGHPAVC